MSLTPVEDIVRCLGKVPYFAGLDETKLAMLASQCRTRTLDLGETILLEGEPAEGLYIVLSGKVRVYKSSPEGREQVLIVLAPGETFNDVPVFDGGPSPASADALAAGTGVCLVPGPVVAQLLTTGPVVAAGVAQVLATRLRHLTVLVEDLSLRQIIQRVARLLLDESSRRFRLDSTHASGDGRARGYRAGGRQQGLARARESWCHITRGTPRHQRRRAKAAGTRPAAPQQVERPGPTAHLLASMPDSLPICPR